MKVDFLHLEGHLHFVFEGAQVDFDHAVDERAFVDVVLTRFLEYAEEAVGDYTRQLDVLKERDLINELKLVVILLWLMSPHGQVLENRLEVGQSYLVEELRVLFLVEVLDQDDLLIA